MTAPVALPSRCPTQVTWRVGPRRVCWTRLSLILPLHPWPRSPSHLPRRPLPTSRGPWWISPGRRAAAASTRRHHPTHLRKKLTPVCISGFLPYPAPIWKVTKVLLLSPMKIILNSCRKRFAYTTPTSNSMRSHTQIKCVLTKKWFFLFNSKLLGTVLITIGIFNRNVSVISFEARKSRRERANKAKSAGNLDDLDSMLDTMISTGTPQMRRKKRDEASTFDLFTKEGKN